MTDAHERRLTAADIAVGDEGPEVVVEELERQDFVRYAGASGDFHPVHFSDPFARDAGNPSVFAQGMLTAGFAGHFLADWLGVDRVRRIRVRFQARVFPGDTVTITGDVTAVTPADAGATVEVEFSATNQDDDVVLEGDGTASLPAE